MFDQMSELSAKGEAEQKMFGKMSKPILGEQQMGHYGVSLLFRIIVIFLKLVGFLHIWTCPSA